MSSEERHVMKAQRAEKKDRVETLEMRASSQLAQIRRDLGGGYVEDLSDVDVEAAGATLDQLKETKREWETLTHQIEELNRRIDG